MARVLLGVRCRIELVTFLQRPAETLGERCCDRRLPAARDACDDEDWVKGSHAHNASRLTPLFPARRAEVTDAARSKTACPVLRPSLDAREWRRRAIHRARPPASARHMPSDQLATSPAAQDQGIETLQLRHAYSPLQICCYCRLRRSLGASERRRHWHDCFFL